MVKITSLPIQQELEEIFLGTAAPQCGSFDSREKEPQWAAAVPKGKDRLAQNRSLLPRATYAW